MQDYFNSPTNSGYRFTSSPSVVHKWAYMWRGAGAQSAWSESNYNLKVTLGNATNKGGTPNNGRNYSFTASTGFCMPMSLLWASGESAGASKFIITNGNTKT